MLSTDNEAIKCNNTNDKLTALDKKVNIYKIIYFLFLSFYYVVIEKLNYSIIYIILLIFHFIEVLKYF